MLYPMLQGKKPQAIFDAATLTGAIIIALGNSHTGFYTKNDKLAERIPESQPKIGGTCLENASCSRGILMILKEPSLIFPT